MVAAWIRADTGVGPSMASGSQVCRRNCADLPMAPTKSRTAIRFAAFQSVQRNRSSVCASCGAAANTSSKPMPPTAANSAKMPSAKPKSPTRLTTNALIAAALALSLRW